MAWTISIKVGCKFCTIYPNYRNWYTKFEMILIQIVILVYRKIYWRILDTYAESTYLGPFYIFRTVCFLNRSETKTEIVTLSMGGSCKHRITPWRAIWITRNLDGKENQPNRTGNRLKMDRAILTQLVSTIYWTYSVLWTSLCMYIDVLGRIGSILSDTRLCFKRAFCAM